MGLPPSLNRLLPLGDDDAVVAFHVHREAAIDRWTLLVMRDALFYDKRRFADFQQSAHARG